MGAQIGFAIGRLIGGSLDTIPGRKVGEMASPRAQEGEPIPLVFGSARVTGRLMSTGKPDIRKEKEGGKGGPKVENETAYLSYSILVAESSALRDSSLTGILMVIQNNEIVYDVRATPAISAADSAKWKKNKIFYFGGEAQAVDPTEQMIHGVGNVPAYRGLCRMVVTDEDVTQHGGSVPTYEFVTTQCVVVAPVGNNPWLITHAAGTVEANRRFLDATFAAQPSIYDAPEFSGYRIHAVSPSKVLFKARAGIEYAESSDGGDTLVVNNLPSGSIAGDGGFLAFNSGWIVVTVGATGGGGVYRLPIGGGAWEFKATGDFSQRIAAAGERMAAVSTGDPRARISDDAYATSAWSTGNFTPYAVRSAVEVISNGASFMAASISGAAEGYACSVAYSVDGQSWATVGTMTAGDGSQGFIGGALGDLWVFCRSDGPTLYGSSTSMAQGTGPVNVAQLSGGDGVLAAITATGKVWTTTNGATWTLRYDPGVTGGGGIAYVQGYSGLELPDVPGYYVDKETGVIQGPVTVVTDCGVTLSQIVEKLDTRAGIPVANRVTTSLSGITVPGYAIDTFQTVAESKEPLRRVYFFDCPEYDDAIRYRLRGGATDFTVLPDDLIIGEDATEQGTRGQTVEFPKRLHVQYVDPATGYKPMKQTAERISPDIRVKGEEVVSANLTLSATTAKRAADMGLKTAWTAREDSREIALPMDYLKAIPSDCFSLSGRRYRITDLRIEAGAMYVQSEYDRTSAYSSTVVGTVGPVPTAPPSNIIGPTDFVVMNLPVLRDADDDPVLYFAARGYTAGWNGARLQLAMPGFETVANLTTACIMGTLLAPLPVADRDVLDTTNTLSVRMSGALNSVTFDSLLNEANVLAILYADNTAEILQFQTAIEVTPGVYNLTTLIRGRLDTDIATHATGARVVLLNDSIRSFIVRRTELLRPPLWFRVVTNGLPEPALNDPATTLYVSNVETESTKEWPVSMVEWSRDASNNLIVTWLGRARLGTDALPTHSRFFAGYRVTVTDGTVIRSWDTTLQSAIVTAAEQVSVFGSSSFTPTVTVTPTSSINGAVIGGGVPFPVGLAGWTSTEAGWSYVAGSAVYNPTVSGVPQSILRRTTPTSFPYGARLFYASCERTVSGSSVGGVGYAYYSGATFTGKTGIGTVHYTVSTVTADPIPTADGIAPIVYANTDGVTSVSFSNIAHSISE